MQILQQILTRLDQMDDNIKSTRAEIANGRIVLRNKARPEETHPRQKSVSCET